MERIRLITNNYKGYKSIPNESDNIIVKKVNFKKKSYKCIKEMSNNGTFMIKNLKGYLDISKYDNDILKRMTCRYVIAKDKIVYIKLKDHKNSNNLTEYQLTISIYGDENIEASFYANEANEIYNFLKHSLRNWNILETKK